jgi:hypothetical protein
VPGTNIHAMRLTNRLDTRQELVRADYAITPGWSATGRYLHDRLDGRGEALSLNLTPTHRYQVGHLSVLEARHTGARLLHEFSYQLSSHTLARGDTRYEKGSLGITIPELAPENAAGIVPNISIAGLDGLGGQQPFPREYRNHTFSSTVTWLHGTHTLKAGGLAAIERINSNLYPETTSGAFGFEAGGGFTAYQNFLRGNAGGECGPGCGYFEVDLDVMNRFRTARYEAFVQDTWRPHPRVTLDAGLRYAYFPPLTDADDKLFTFSPSAYDPAQAPAFAEPEGFLLQRGTGNLFNGLLVAGQNSPYGRAIYGADTNNVQPRVGMAWDPFGTGRTSVRAGYGIYFDQTHAAMFAQNVQESSYDPFRTEFFVSNPPLSHPAAGSAIEPSVAFTPDSLATSEVFVAPRRQHWNIGVQRLLYDGGIVDLGYIGGTGDHLPRYVDINRPNPAALLAAPENQNAVRPFLGYAAIVMRETTAKSRYHAVQATFRHEAGRGGSGMVNYTLSRNTADASYDNSPIDAPQDVSNPAAEFGRATTDRMHVLTASYVLGLPFGRGGNGWRDALAGGWQIAGIARFESGPAARLTAFNCGYGGWCYPAPMRPDQRGDPAEGRQQGLFWFDPNAFAPPPAGGYGSAPVDPLRLPGRHQWDLTISKSISVRGQTRLQLRADFINAFNHTQFLDVSTDCGGTTACEGGRFGQVTSTRPPREIQLGVRLAW